MGLMVDTSVFIRFEKAGNPIDFSAWDNSQQVFISAVTAAELLLGARAATTRDLPLLSPIRSKAVRLRSVSSSRA
jgi:predicted nucleic acid-binding protein